MTAQHTPGPWEAECRDVTYKGGDWSKDNFLQWEVYGPEDPTGRGSFHQADALLIAAAPDLLEALKSVQAAIYMDDAGQLRLTRSFDESVIDAAIQKATQVGAHKEGD